MLKVEAEPFHLNSMNYQLVKKIIGVILIILFLIITNFFLRQEEEMTDKRQGWGQEMQVNPRPLDPEALPIYD